VTSVNVTQRTLWTYGITSTSRLLKTDLRSDFGWEFGCQGSEAPWKCDQRRVRCIGGFQLWPMPDAVQHDEATKISSQRDTYTRNERNRSSKTHLEEVTIPASATSDNGGYRAYLVGNRRQFRSG
jgi:hypothetical protein